MKIDCTVQNTSTSDVYSSHLVFDSCLALDFLGSGMITAIVLIAKILTVQCSRGCEQFWYQNTVSLFALNKLLCYIYCTFFFSPQHSLGDVRTDCQKLMCSKRFSQFCGLKFQPILMEATALLQSNWEIVYKDQTNFKTFLLRSFVTAIYF